MARQDHDPIPQEKIDGFLERLAAGDSVVAAAGDEAFRRRLYRLRAADTAFAAEWKLAYTEGTDVLVAEARRRAVEGVDEPRMLGDNLVQLRKYSDPLLMFLIKQRDPSYRDNSKVEVTGSGGGPVQIEHRGVRLADVLNVAREAGLHAGD